MAAGLTDDVWTFRGLLTAECALLDTQAPLFTGDGAVIPLEELTGESRWVGYYDVTHRYRNVQKLNCM
jgi:hypothetical protein